MKRDGVSHDVSMCPCTNPLILIMGISLLPVARSLFPFNININITFNPVWVNKSFE
ncbi:MAG: hypothetical protein V7K67_11805 [Nostoc sp.]